MKPLPGRAAAQNGIGVQHVKQADQEAGEHAGDGADVAIEKTYRFRDYYQTLAFVNALALIAHRHDHHPDLLVRYGSCNVRFNTHDVKGLSVTDFDCATAAEALLAPPSPAAATAAT